MRSVKINLICLFYVYFVNIVSEGGSLSKWPSRFPRCYRDDPKLNSCILEATKAMKPFLKEGIPDFNLQPISPFHIPEVKISQEGDTASLNVVLRNLVITGFDSYEFEKFNFDPKSLQFDSKLKMGVLDFNCDYVTNGKILTIPIQGNGTMSFKVLSSEAALKQVGKLARRKGVTYLALDAPVVSITVGDVVNGGYTGFFEGNEVFARAAEKVFQEHQQEIIEEIKPAVEKVIEEIVYDIEKKIWKVPYDELYPLHK